MKHLSVALGLGRMVYPAPSPRQRCRVKRLDPSACNDGRQVVMQRVMTRPIAVMTMATARIVRDKLL